MPRVTREHWFVVHLHPAGDEDGVEDVGGGDDDVDDVGGDDDDEVDDVGGDGSSDVDSPSSPSWGSFHDKNGFIDIDNDNLIQTIYNDSSLCLGGIRT